MADYQQPPGWVGDALRRGLVIPAHPLAVTADRKLDERRQRALARYYHAAGAGGIAVGVHTTQFAIHERPRGLYQPVLQLASETIAACDQAAGKRTVRIAGICGNTPQATAEAALARDSGYHAGLLSLATLQKATDEELLEHCRAVARELALIGFYLQPAVGGRVLSLNFWRRFAEIPNVLAIKLAPFNRYQTLDVIRAVAEAGRATAIALYTGNDDCIVFDLVSEYAIPTATRRGTERLRMVGGLLGHWACWTQKAVELHQACQQAYIAGRVPAQLLTLAGQVTDCNAAFFDAVHQFAGCLTGIHEVLRRQGLLANNFCLDPQEGLSPGQEEEIDRVCRAYPHLNDNEFVAEHLSAWLD
jgi:dihydrodipicolinate synthase/N-acetylneuraminate lyase